MVQGKEEKSEREKKKAKQIRLLFIERLHKKMAGAAVQMTSFSVLPSKEQKGRKEFGGEKRENIHSALRRRWHHKKVKSVVCLRSIRKQNVSLRYVYTIHIHIYVYVFT